MRIRGARRKIKRFRHQTKGRGIGLRSCFVQIQSSLPTGSYVMAAAEQREPYESRGSRTVLGEPEGESPPGHSTIAPNQRCDRDVRMTLNGIGPPQQGYASTMT